LKFPLFLMVFVDVSIHFRIWIWIWNPRVTDPDPAKVPDPCGSGSTTLGKIVLRLPVHYRHTGTVEEKLPVPVVTSTVVLKECYRYRYCISNKNSGPLAVKSGLGPGSGAVHHLEWFKGKLVLFENVK
jgi:hypothetical protein